MNIIITELKLSINNAEHKIALAEEKYYMAIELEKNKCVIELLKKDRLIDQEKARADKEMARADQEKLKNDLLLKDIKILEMEKLLLTSKVEPSKTITKKMTKK